MDYLKTFGYLLFVGVQLAFVLGVFWFFFYTVGKR